MVFFYILKSFDYKEKLHFFINYLPINETTFKIAALINNHVIMDLPEKYRYNSPEKVSSDHGSGSSSDDNYEDDKDKDYRDDKDSDQGSIKGDKHVSIDLMLNRRRTYEDIPIKNSLSILNDSNETSNTSNEQSLRYTAGTIDDQLRHPISVNQNQNQSNPNYDYKPDIGEFYDDIKPGRRFRRRYNQIVRHYSCSYPGCSKSYGSLNHLNTHIVTKKHGQRKSKSDFQSDDSHDYNTGNYWYGFSSNNNNRYPYYMMVRNQPIGHPPPHAQYQPPPQMFMQQPLPMPNQPIILGQPHPHGPPPPPPPPGAIAMTSSMPNQLPTQLQMGNQIPMQLTGPQPVYQVPSMPIPSIQQAGLPTGGIPGAIPMQGPVSVPQQSPGIPNQSPGIPNQQSPIQTNQLAYHNQDYTVRREEVENRFNNFPLPNIRQINPEVHSSSTSAHSSLQTSPHNVTITLPPIKSDKDL